MPKYLSDTHPDIQAVQDARFRGMSAQEKFALISSLSQTVIHHAKRAIRRANPDMSPQEVELYFANSHYGTEVASQMRKWYDRQER